MFYPNHDIINLEFLILIFTYVFNIFQMEPNTSRIEESTRFVCYETKYKEPAWENITRIIETGQ